MSEPKAYQHLKAAQDANGNPRRVFVVYDGNAEIYDVIDEGYAGRPTPLRELAQLPDASITVREYNAWLSHPKRGRMLER